MICIPTFSTNQINPLFSLLVNARFLRVNILNESQDEVVHSGLDREDND